MSNSMTKEGGLLLTILKQHEELLAELYRAYGERFGESRKFWMELSGEEVEHARWLEELAEEVGDCADAMVVKRFDVGAVEKSIEYVKGQIEKACEPEFGHIHALAVALNLEAALIENKYFEVLEGDNPRVKQVLQLLEHSTREHLETVREAVAAASA